MSGCILNNIVYASVTAENIINVSRLPFSEEYNYHFYLELKSLVYLTLYSVISFHFQ